MLGSGAPLESPPVFHAAGTWTTFDHGESERILRRSFSSHCANGFDFQGSPEAHARVARIINAKLPKIIFRIAIWTPRWFRQSGPSALQEKASPSMNLIPDMKTHLRFRNTAGWQPT